MQSLAEAISDSYNFEYKRVRNSPFLTFKSIKETLGLILGWGLPGGDLRVTIIAGAYMLHTILPEPALNLAPNVQ